MSDEPTRRSRVPPAFPSFAYLYRPADDAVTTAVVEADPTWSPPSEPDPEVEVLLWGRLARNVRPTPTTVVNGVRREIAIRRLDARPPTGFLLVDLHRLPPVRRPGAWRQPIRRITLSGALAELVRIDRVDPRRPERVIDAVVTAAASDPAKVRLRPAGDGSALASLAVDGVPAELRVAMVGHTKDPARGHAALIALEATGVARVPRPLGAGVTAGAAWSTETVVPGGHVPELTPSLIDQVTAFLATLPVGVAGSVDDHAVEDQLAEVAEFFPEHAVALADIAKATRRWGAGLQPVLVHGDLWLNNLFTEGDRLSAVFDWDTWHPAGVPGTDLLNLLAAEVRTRERRDIGPLLLTDHWRSPEVIDALRPYFRARNQPFPDAAGLAAIGAAWWASRIAGALHRGLRQIDDPDWTRRNLVDALPRFERLEKELG